MLWEKNGLNNGHEIVQIDKRILCVHACKSIKEQITGPSALVLWTTRRERALVEWEEDMTKLSGSDWRAFRSFYLSK